MGGLGWLFPAAILFAKHEAGVPVLPGDGNSTRPFPKSCASTRVVTNHAKESTAWQVGATLGHGGVDGGMGWGGSLCVLGWS